MSVKSMLGLGEARMKGSPLKALVAALLCFLIAACVGSVQILLDSARIDQTFVFGEQAALNVTGKWTASDASITADKVFLQLQDNDSAFVMPATLALSAGNQFTFSVVPLADLSVGTHSGTLTIRACADAACAKPYTNATAKVDVPYTLVVKATPEWTTMQHDASHSGYVPITLDPVHFAKAWEWRRTLDDPIGGINPVVTSNGLVYVSKDVYDGQAVLYALNEADGTEAWKVSLGVRPALNPPAVADGRAYVATTGHGDTYLWAFDALTGTFLFQSSFDAQWPHVLAPTPYADQVFTNGGYYGGGVYAFAAVTGARQWSAFSGSADMTTPAVDQDNVYFHSGTKMEIRNRLTGESVASIVDPFGSSSGYSYHGAPMLGSRNNVVSFAGTAFSGRASSNVEQYEQRVLSSFNIASKTYEWSTANAYLTAPAVAKGVIYAARNTPMSLDALDEATGKLLWSWTPSGAGDTAFHRNIVVTRNLLFVSTDRAVYAIDLATRAAVWSYPEPGMLAISANQVLYIATGARESDGKLVAIKLR